MIGAAVICLLCVALLLVAEWRSARGARALFKTAASLAFVLAAWMAGAAASGYGQLVLAALAFGVLGDVLLLSARSAAFLGGLAAFLGCHALFAAAFVQAGVSLPATGLGLAVALPVGALILRWLWPHLGPQFRAPVVVYVVVILAMCALAAGADARQGGHRLLPAALLFALSDIAVAREKFVSPGFVNRAWGLPLYYVAQLLFAASVAPA